SLIQTSFVLLFWRHCKRRFNWRCVDVRQGFLRYLVLVRYVLHLNKGKVTMNSSDNSEFGVADWQRLLRSIGEDPSRQGLRETPGRVTRAWAHWTRGYQQDPATILKTFADGGESYDELIV